MNRESLDRFLPGRRLAMAALGLLAAIVIGIGIYWSIAPAPFNVNEVTARRLGNTESKQVIGSTSAATLIEIAETLLEKPGGFLSNDIMPPGLYLDNIPNWEFGVLVQVRDFSRAFREDFSRSQSQSTEDADLIIAEPKFNFTNDSWLFPASESQYKEAIAALNSYLLRMVDADQSDAQFYARADNLASWLSNVESRLGSLSQRLSASVLQQRANTDMAGDPSATQSTPARAEVAVKTPWLEIDDVFFEARGATWALLHFLRAAEVDFAQVLDDKNAGASLDQIIRELEASQRSLGFPMVLNGSGFGMFANHSLTMANYVSRANAAIIDLRRLLSQG
ncbi:MAG: DUF2333 family protein [Gammaproteobacteria bacterium]|nr:DUF2333 family protein [OM182 bacterium]MDP4782556.1 DUF2333 family protein [Gammaproteobacteria bacterium]